MTATADAPFSGPVATFQDANPFATASDYVVTIQWGDGHISAGSVALVAAGFQVTGTNTYGSGGQFPILVSILNADGAHVAATTTASVASSVLTAAGVPLAATEGAPFSAVVATFTDTNPDAATADYTATIDWGDGQTSVGSLQVSLGLAGQFAVLGSHTYAEEGTDSVNVTLSAQNGASGRAAPRRRWQTHL